MVKNGICFGGASQENILFFDKCAPKKRVPSISRRGPACTLRKIQTYGLITREFLGLRMQKFHGVILKWIRTYMEFFKSALMYL